VTQGNASGNRHRFNPSSFILSDISEKEKELKKWNIQII